MKTIKCQYCGEENPDPKYGGPDNCFACGLFFELKDQLKDWQTTLDIERKCLRKWRLFGREDCAIELTVIIHEMQNVFDVELQKTK